MAPAPIRLLAGPAAARHLADRGLRPADIVAVVGAAGGPKGLALLPLDRWLFGHWLADCPRERWLAGASIGAWRMAAGAQRAPLPAIERLAHAYLEGQRYPRKPSTAQVSQVCRDMTRELIGHDPAAFLAGLAPGRRLQVVTARSLAPDAAATRLAFGRAALDNAVARARLGRHLQRVVFTAGAESTADGCPALPPDAFDSRCVPLQADNLEDALLASGSIPLVADPVPGVGGAPAGRYWDGGLIDYHLHWRWQTLPGIVLMPHFLPAVTAGWLDKFLPWRRHGLGPADRDWLDNLLLVIPSPALLARLPNRKLPDRQDFFRYDTDHDARLRDWRRAMAECEAMAEAFAAWVERPDRIALEPLPG
ncbi:MAG: patatin-like phospholipase family protein [Betaproteobacteria bacterium]|nr:patatin-like phospholipase family protein [Betaproteobacteria bacterium]